MGQKRRSLTDDAKKKFTQDIKNTTSSINSSDLSTNPHSKAEKDHNSIEAAEDLMQKKDGEFTERIDPSAKNSSPSFIQGASRSSFVPPKFIEEEGEELKTGETLRSQHHFTPFFFLPSKM